MDSRDFDAETPDQALNARQRGKWYNEGFRGTDGLTVRERLLLDTLRQQGLEVRTGRIVNARTQTSTMHRRVVA